MSRSTFNDLLEAGAHFGHLRRKWNPAMAPYIYAEKNGIHIIDLNITVAKIEEAAEALKQIARSGRKVLFVATKKQAKDIVAEKVKTVNMPYVTERWIGGMLTNSQTITQQIKKLKVYAGAEHPHVLDLDVGGHADDADPVVADRVDRAGHVSAVPTAAA